MSDLTGKHYDNQYEYLACGECGQLQLSFALDKDGICYYCSGSLPKDRKEKVDG